MQRRDFLSAVGLTSIAASFPVSAGVAQRSQAHLAVGLELISVLTPMGVEFRQTLHKVAAIGYTEVETLGSLGRSPEEVYEVLAQCHLSSPAQHLVPDDLYEIYQRWDRGDLTLPQAIARLQEGYALEKLDHIIEQGIARAHALHQQFLVWPVLFDDQVASRRALQMVIDAFNRAGELCRQSGLTFAFHNGSNASRRIDQATAYDLILKQTDQATVKMELDTYYLTKSGASALAYLVNYPNRYPLMHLKDIDEHGEIVDVGRGTIDFAGLLSAARHAGVQHFFVEHDRAVDPFGSARASFDYVRHL
jgi:sugar phosphate isomerase/epimerase